MLELPPGGCIILGRFPVLGEGPKCRTGGGRWRWEVEVELGGGGGRLRWRWEVEVAGCDHSHYTSALLYTKEPTHHCTRELSLCAPPASGSPWWHTAPHLTHGSSASPAAPWALQGSSPRLSWLPPPGGFMGVILGTGGGQRPMTLFLCLIHGTI